MLDIVKKSFAFNSLGQTDLEKIVQISEKRKTQEGEILAEEKQRAAFYFLLVSGALMISMDSEKACVLDRAGDFAGFGLLSSKGLYISRVTSLLNGEVIAVSRNGLLDIIGDNSSAGEIIMENWRQFSAKKCPFLKTDNYLSAEYQY
ncbi:MAG: hypothetical protein R6U68_16215 [Desulfobacteraceae bacterium]